MASSEPPCLEPAGATLVRTLSARERAAAAAAQQALAASLEEEKQMAAELAEFRREMLTVQAPVEPEPEPEPELGQGYVSSTLQDEVAAQKKLQSVGLNPLGQIAHSWQGMRCCHIRFNPRRHILFNPRQAALQRLSFASAALDIDVISQIMRAHFMMAKHVTHRGRLNYYRYCHILFNPRQAALQRLSFARAALDIGVISQIMRAHFMMAKHVTHPTHPRGLNYYRYSNMYGSGWRDDDEVLVAFGGQSVAVAKHVTYQQEGILGPGAEPAITEPYRPYKAYKGPHHVVTREDLCTLERARHPNIVSFLGIHATQLGTWIAFEPSLRTLGDVLHRRSMRTHNFRHTMTWRNRLRMMYGVARGLAFLHSIEPRVVHTNISPLSLFVTNSVNVKVGNLSAARCIIQDRQELAAEGHCIARVEYAAPEVLMLESYNESVDIYSFGVVLWEMATRCRPWHNKPIHMIVGRKISGHCQLPLPTEEQEHAHGALPDGYMELMYSCMATQRESRPTIHAVLDELRRMGLAAGRTDAT